MSQPCDDQSRADFCRQQAIVLANETSRNQAQLADVLMEVHDRNYWGSDFPTFEAYCVEELGIALRTAQHLMKTFRQCLAAGVSRETIEKLGWSKMALLAGKIAPGNKDELLMDAAALSHAALKDKYHPGTKSRGANERQPQLKITTTIQRAIIRAGAFTDSDDLQQNLEYIAKQFIEDHPREDYFNANRINWG